MLRPGKMNTRGMGGFSKADRGLPLRMVAGKGIRITGGCMEMKAINARSGFGIQP